MSDDAQLAAVAFKRGSSCVAVVKFMTSLSGLASTRPTSRKWSNRCLRDSLFITTTRQAALPGNGCRLSEWSTEMRWGWQPSLRCMYLRACTQYKQCEQYRHKRYRAQCKTTTLTVLRMAEIQRCTLDSLVRYQRQRRWTRC